jgi:putative MATE family efflux protein
MDFMHTKAKGNGITEGVIWKQLLVFFFPILLGTFFQQLYNTVDAIIVGNFVGKEALAAVGGSTGTLINLLIGFFVGLSSGGSVIISQFYGGDRQEETSRAVHTLIMLGLLASLLFMVVGLVFSRQALHLIAVPDEIMDYSLTYMRIYFVGVAFPILYNIGSAILRAVGDSRRPLYFLIVCCLTNVVLDLLFVVGLRMEVAGVAIATLLSQAVSVLLTFGSLMKTTHCYRVVLRKLRIDPALLKSMLRLGLPVGLQSTLYTVSNLMIQSSINSFGTDVIAAWTAVGKVDSLFWMAINAFGVSITTFAGQNFGAGKYDRVRKSVRVGMGMALGMTVVISGVILLIRDLALGLFTTDANVVSYGSQMILYMVTFYILYVPIEILSGAIKGTGNSLIPMIITLLGICVLRVSWVLILLPIRHDLLTLTVSYPVSWAVTSVIFILYYCKGRWMKVPE